MILHSILWEMNLLKNNGTDNIKKKMKKYWLQAHEKFAKKKCFFESPKN